MTSRGAAIAKLIAAVVGLLISLAVAGAGGFVALLIDPDGGGSYGGNQQEIHTALAVASLGALASLGCLAGVILSALALSRSRQPPG
jgi:hypothetical protein